MTGANGNSTVSEHVILPPIIMVLKNNPAAFDVHRYENGVEETIIILFNSSVLLALDVGVKIM